MTMLSFLTMLSFRVPADDAVAIQRWGEAPGVDRSEILRDALHRHPVGLSGESDPEKWRQQPSPRPSERCLMLPIGDRPRIGPTGRCKGVRSASPARPAQID